MSKKVGNKIELGPFRCMFPTLDQPQQYKDKGEFNYSIQILIPKSDKVAIDLVMETITKTIRNSDWVKAVQDRVLKIAKGSKDPTNKFATLKDGDVKNQTKVESEKAPLEHLKGHYVLTARKKQKFGAPLVVNQQRKQIPTADVAKEILAGDYVNIQLSSYTYGQADGDPGATWNLEAVQKVKKGEPFPVHNIFDDVDEIDDVDEDEEVPFDEV
jgi:hypothetical protein